MLSNNEKYLLKFISSLNGEEENEPKDNLLNTIIKLGIKINFNDNNSVYQIIDELNFNDYVKTGK